VVEHKASHECREQLHACIYTKCPCALEDPTLLAQLVEIVEEEVERAFREKCWKFIRLVSEPCKQ
jgi:hypothetical protein